MLKVHYYVLVVCLISILFMAGCFKTPSETMNIPEYSAADSIFNIYKKMLRENQPPKKLLEYLKENISKLHKETADIAIIRIIELQKKQLVEYQEKYKTYSNQIKEIQEKKEKELHDVSDVRNFIESAAENGFIVIVNKGVEIDYQKVKKIAGDYVSDELKAYIEIESEESVKKYSLAESLDEYLAKQPSIKDYLLSLAEILKKTFEYTDNYKDSPYTARINELRTKYLYIFLFGSPKNSAFSDYLKYSTNVKKNQINPSWKSAYGLIIEKYSNGRDKFGVYVSNYYYNELSKNKFELTETLYQENIEKISGIDNDDRYDR